MKTEYQIIAVDFDGTLCTDCFPKMISGDIKGLFIFGEDPVRTDPNTHHVIKSLESLHFFAIDGMVQEVGTGI